MLIYNNNKLTLIRNKHKNIMYSIIDTFSKHKDIIYTLIDNINLRKDNNFLRIVIINSHILNINMRIWAKFE